MFYLFHCTLEFYNNTWEHSPVTNAQNQIAASSTAASRKNNNKKVNKRKGNTSVKKKIVSDVVVPGVGPIGFISWNEYRSMTREQRQRLRDERDKHGVAGGNKSRNVAAVATSATSIDAPTLERMLDAVSQCFCWNRSNQWAGRECR
jgi:hypothetical protein